MNPSLDLKNKFVLFYVSFRHSELTKRGKNPHDDVETKAFDEMMLSEHYDTYFLQTMDFYAYIKDALDFGRHQTDAVYEEKSNVNDPLNWMTDEDEEEYERIKEADKALNDCFVLFYASFRTSVLLKVETDPDDEQESQNFDNAMSYDSSYRREFYDYICDSLVVLLT